MTEQLLLMLQGAAALLALLLPSFLVMLFPHPTEVQKGAARALLSLLGRFLALGRHGRLRGALHLPGRRQPAPQRVPEISRRCPECGCGPVFGGKIPHEPGCRSVDYVHTVDGVHCYTGPLAGRPARWRSEADTLPDPPPPPTLSSMTTSPRIPSVAALLLGLGLVLSSACLSATDHARAQLTQALKLATSVQQKFKAQDAGFQIKIVETATSAPEGAKALLSWRERRKVFTGAAQRCDSVIDDAADQLLLSDRAAGVNAARQAQLCAEGLRESLLKIFDGGL